MIAFEKDSGAAPEDLGILGEIQQSLRYAVYVEHADQWVSGCQFGSLSQARVVALQAFQKVHRPVEVRDRTGQTLLRIEPLAEALESQAAPA